jgi:hypothetical protein
VQANKLIKGANRPVSRKNSSIPSKKSQSFDLNLQRLCTEQDYLPARQIGPVDVAVKSGETGKLCRHAEQANIPSIEWHPVQIVPSLDCISKL